MLTEPVLIKEIKKINAVVVRNFLQEQEEKRGRMRRDLYIMDVDKRKYCYNCREFGHIIRYYRSWEIVGQGRRIK